MKRTLGARLERMHVSIVRFLIFFLSSLAFTPPNFVGFFFLTHWRQHWIFVKHFSHRRDRSFKYSISQIYFSLMTNHGVSLTNIFLAQIVPYKIYKIYISYLVRLGDVLCTSCKLWRSDHNGVFPVEGQLIILWYNVTLLRPLFLQWRCFGLLLLEKSVPSGNYFLVEIQF